MYASTTCLHSPWLNVKMGKFELDSFISEKRTLTLSGKRRGYQLFHFIPSAMATSSARSGTTSSGSSGWDTL
jgi:hypothetical protein